MSASIELLDTPATVASGLWESPSPTLQAALQTRAKWIGNSPSDPDIDETLALDAEEILGATITKHSDAPVSSGKAVY